jgi:hypothetical protein
MKSDIFFKENGYLHVKGLIDADNLYSYIEDLAKNGKGKADEQVKGSYTFYKEERCEQLLENMIPKMEDLTGHKLFKTYSFARIYKNGQILRAHRDREACEITVTICVGYTGEPWPIWLLDNEERARSFILTPGDGLIFRGGEHTHWRELNNYGATTNILLHYVDRAGQYAAHENDKHNFRFGFSIPFFKSTLKFGVEKAPKVSRKEQM